jgi:hypothetical protein
MGHLWRQRKWMCGMRCWLGTELVLFVGVGSGDHAHPEREDRPGHRQGGRHHQPHTAGRFP